MVLASIVMSKERSPGFNLKFSFVDYSCRARLLDASAWIQSLSNARIGTWQKFVGPDPIWTVMWMDCINRWREEEIKLARNIREKRNYSLAELGWQAVQRLGQARKTVIVLHRCLYTHTQTNILYNRIPSVYRVSNSVDMCIQHLLNHARYSR